MSLILLIILFILIIILFLLLLIFLLLIVILFVIFLFLLYFLFRAVYHRGGLLSQSVHLLEGARSKFEEAYNQFPSCVEGIILYSLVSIITHNMICCTINISIYKMLKRLENPKSYYKKQLNWNLIMLMLISLLVYYTW